MPIDEIAAAQLGLRALGGLLSLPRAFQADAQQNTIARDMMISALGYTPEEAAQKLPEQGMLGRVLNPGTYQNPIARGTLGAVGDLGNVINSLMGQPIRAPRVDPGEMSQMLTASQRAAEARRRQQLAGQLEEGKVPTTRDLAGLALAEGNVGTARDLLFPESSPQSTSTNSIRLRLNTLRRENPQDPQIPILEETLRQIEQAGLARAKVGGTNVHIANITQNQESLEKIKVDAAFKLAATKQVYASIIPKMQFAAKALTTSPIYAKTVQPAAIWMAAAFGSEEAKTVQTLMADAMKLARTVDVGNLSATEREIWEPFVAGANMTRQEFLAGLSVLDKQLRRSHEVNQGIMDAQSWDQVRPFLSLPPLQQQPSGSSPARDEFENLLNQYR